MHKRGQTLCLPLLIRAPALYGEGPTLLTSLNLIPSLKALSPYTVTSGVKSSTYEFQGDTTQSRVGSFPQTAHSLVVDTGLSQLNRALWWKREPESWE